MRIGPAILVVLVPALALAQQPDSVGREVCFPGASAPLCTWMVEVDLLMTRRVNSDRNERGGPAHRYGMALGLLLNTSARSAGGLLAFADGVEGEGRHGIALRYRRWLDVRSPLDLDLGIVLGGYQDRQPIRGTGAVAQVSIMVEGRAGFVVRTDLVRDSAGLWRRSVFAGGRLSGEPALLLLLLVGRLILACPAGCLD
ncbi:MAG TPA: hypothetical protein VNL98_04175 [Gemmatimonadales bacterium]|nr:hypothetical protein [Gemmatimonadales bacterium]